MKIRKMTWSPVLLLGWLFISRAAFAQTTDALVGIWRLDEGFQITDFLFRSDGRYQVDTRSTDPDFDYSSSERGRYALTGDTLTLSPYDFLGEDDNKEYVAQILGPSLSLSPLDLSFTKTYEFQPGSRAVVLAHQDVAHDLIATWERAISFAGKVQYTFRPGGYYFRKSIPEGDQFPPEYIRGRYEFDGTHLTLRPYSGTDAASEVDFFGDGITIIEKSGVFGEGNAYTRIPGSDLEVRAKAAESEAFLSQTNWYVGVWEIREDFLSVDVTVRPDGHYATQNYTEFLQGTVRGRYELAPGEVQLQPYPGQGIYARSNGDFGKVDQSWVLDYYDGELQFINPASLSQTVHLARKRAQSMQSIIDKTQQAGLERARADWQVGIWQVNDPAGWMEFTFRPDGRYIGKSGTEGVPSRVERGQYLLKPEKLTLSPYLGLGAAQGYEMDLYDGEWVIAGDLNRLIVARKFAGSEAEVIEKTTNPTALKGERGSILGLWTANTPGGNSELVFRPDGEFRLTRCSGGTVSQDYGLYSVNLAARTLVYDSRFTPVQTLGLDFYGDTLTLYGGVAGPTTYTVNLGTVDASIAASLAADAADAEVDAQWFARVPLAPRSESAQPPVGNIPADPFPGRVFSGSTAFEGSQLYRRLILGAVYFNELGTIKSVPVVNTREWHFFPNGRVLIRFKNYSAAPVYPNTIENISDSWGAYRIEPKPDQRDIIHIYAENVVFIESDAGEQVEMTIEDGRRNLFWGKDYQLLSTWAAEQKAIPCDLPANPNANLINTGLSLSTGIAPDSVGEPQPFGISITGPVAGHFTISGNAAETGPLIIERAAAIRSQISWEAVQTNTLPAGPFSLTVPQGSGTSAYFRLRMR